MRKSLDDFLLSDWIDAFTSMNRSKFLQLRKIAMHAGIEVPAFVKAGNKPLIRFEFKEDGHTDRYQRSQNLDRVKAFKADIETWASKVERYLKASVLLNKNYHRKNPGKSLAESVTHKVHLDKDYGVEPRSIGFKFARHGIYLAKGAYRGHGGFIGSKWTNAYGTLKATNPESRGKIGEGTRQPLDWFNPIIDDHIEELKEIATRYCADMTFDLTRLHIR